MIQRRPCAVALSLLAAVALSAMVVVGCAGGGGDDDDDAATTQTPACTPLSNSNLSTLQSAIFTPQCALPSCHSASVMAGALDLSSAATSHAEMVGVLAAGTFNSNNLDIVSPGNAAGSFLYLKVTGATGISGNPMPDTGQTLCAEKIDAIEAWIDAGAANN